MQLDTQRGSATVAPRPVTAHPCMWPVLYRLLSGPQLFFVKVRLTLSQSCGTFKTGKGAGDTNRPKVRTRATATFWPPGKPRPPSLGSLPRLQPPRSLSPTAKPRRKTWQVLVPHLSVNERRVARMGSRLVLTAPTACDPLRAHLNKRAFGPSGRRGPRQSCAGGASQICGGGQAVSAPQTRSGPKRSTPGQFRSRGLSSCMRGLWSRDACLGI
jgi:hypothetical protein